MVSLPMVGSSEVAVVRQRDEHVAIASPVTPVPFKLMNSLICGPEPGVRRLAVEIEGRTRRDGGKGGDRVRARAEGRAAAKLDDAGGQSEVAREGVVPTKGQHVRPDLASRPCPSLPRH